MSNHRYDRAKFSDPNYKADDYVVDDRVKDGPLDNRSCTDLLFTIVFLAFLVGLGIVSIFGFENGKPERLLAPLDADGNFCGLDALHKAYPYLYFADLYVNPTDIPATAVCVKKCPMDDDQPVECISTLNIDCDNIPKEKRYNTTLLFAKACLPILKELPSEALDRYNQIVSGLGINDIGQGIDDVMNTWPIYCIGLATAFIVT
jgi:hypothetical protein